MSAPAPRFRRLEPDARREQILACAVRLFGERAYAEVSTTDIAHEAGVARGLINHYFGTKKGLYLDVVRVLTRIPEEALDALPEGDLATRVDAGVTWFLDTVSTWAPPWLALTGADGPDRDDDVAQVLRRSEEVVVDRVLAAVGLGPQEAPEPVRALVRAYATLARATAREWLGTGRLTRQDAHDLLSTTLVAVVEQVVPAVRTRHRQGD